MRVYCEESRLESRLASDVLEHRSPTAAVHAQCGVVLSALMVPWMAGLIQHVDCNKVGIDEVWAHSGRTHAAAIRVCMDTYIKPCHTTKNVFVSLRAVTWLGGST
eukprot:360578-Chlamydomonas_euryale.AAC.8